MFTHIFARLLVAKDVLKLNYGVESFVLNLSFEYRQWSLFIETKAASIKPPRLRVQKMRNLRNRTVLRCQRQ